MNTLQEKNADIHYATVVGKFVTSILSSNQATFSVYESSKSPSISVSNYIKRWIKYSECGATPVMMAVIYINRLCTKTGIVLTIRNIHRIVLIAMLIAIKIYDDNCYSNMYYAKVGSISFQEINILEEHFLRDIEWDLFITNKEMLVYINMTG